MGGWWCLYFNMLQKLIFLRKSLDKANVMWLIFPERRHLFLPITANQIILAWIGLVSLGSSLRHAAILKCQAALELPDGWEKVVAFWSQTELGLNSGLVTYLTHLFINFILRQIMIKYPLSACSMLCAGVQRERSLLLPLRDHCCWEFNTLMIWHMAR